MMTVISDHTNHASPDCADVTALSMCRMQHTRESMLPAEVLEMKTWDQERPDKWQVRSFMDKSVALDRQDS